MKATTMNRPPPRMKKTPSRILSVFNTPAPLLPPPLPRPEPLEFDATIAAYINPPSKPPNIGSINKRPLGLSPASSGGPAVARSTVAWQLMHSVSVSIITVWQFLHRIGYPPDCMDNQL